MKNKSLIKEVKHFQKIAGLLKENQGAQWMSKLNPEVEGIEIYNDGDNRLILIFDKNTGGIHVVNDWNGEDWDEVWGTDGDVRPELLASLKEGGVREDYHPDDPAGWDSAAARGEDDYEGEEQDEVKQPKYTVGTEVSSFYASWRVVEVYNNFAELRHKDPEEAEAAMMARLDSRNNKESEEELMSQPWYGMKGTSMMSSGGMIDYKPQSALDNMTVDK